MVSIHKIFANDQRGVAATEFALIVPILVSLFLGVVEVSNLLTADAKMRAATAAVADLVTQDPDGVVNQADIDFYHAAAQRIMYPMPAVATRLQIYITDYSIYSPTNVTVSWRRQVGHAGDPTAGGINACNGANLPAALRSTAQVNDVVEVRGSYAWQPIFFSSWGGYTLTATNYNMPRYSLRLPLASTVTPNGC